MQHEQGNTPAGGPGSERPEDGLKFPSAPAPIVLQAADVLAMRARLKVDPRLLSTRGVIEVFNQLSGITSIVEEVTDASSFRKFTQDNNRFTDGLLQDALYFAMEGTLALAQGRVPGARTSKYSDPVGAYLGSLELLTARLDDQAGFEAMRKEHSEHFRSMRWTHAWNEAVNSARRWEYEAREALSADGGEGRTHTGRESGVKVILIDENRQEVGRFTTFHLNEPAPLAEFPALLDRPVFANRFSVGATSGASSFAKTFLKVSEYPDQSIAMAAKVERLVGVLPLDPGTQKVLFRLGILMPDGVVSIDLLTGQGWLTEHSRLYSQNHGGRVVGFGPPAGGGIGLSEDLFSAAGTAALGPSRSALAEMIGADASRSIVIVLKDCISPQRASFFREVLAIKLGTKTITRAAEAIAHDPGRTSLLVELDALIAGGHIRSEDAAELRLEVAKLRAKEHVNRPLTLFDSGGLVGGNGMFSFKSMAGLHTGAANIGSGNLFGVMRETKVPNPLVPPKIIILYPCGIGPELPRS